MELMESVNLELYIYSIMGMDNTDPICMNQLCGLVLCMTSTYNDEEIKIYMLAFYCKPIFIMFNYINFYSPNFLYKFIYIDIKWLISLSNNLYFGQIVLGGIINLLEAKGGYLGFWIVWLVDWSKYIYIYIHFLRSDHILWNQSQTYIYMYI